MSKIEEARKQFKEAQKQLEMAVKEEKSDIVKKMKEDIIALQLTKGDLRGNAMKQLLGKDYEKVYPPKK